MNVLDDILVVDDEIPNLQLLSGLLEKEGYVVRSADSARTALDAALARVPGLILLKVRMPKMDGFEFCQHLKQDERTQHVPVIFISALQDTEAKIQGFNEGGVDYIGKPFVEQEVLARVRTHVQLHQLQQNFEKMVEDRTVEVLDGETRFFDIVENANEAIVVSQDRVVKYCNSMLRELTGYSPKEMCSLSFDAIIHPEDLDGVLIEYQAGLSCEKTKGTNIIRIVDKNGQERDTIVKSALINWDGGPATLVMLTEINEIKQAQETINKREKLFRNMFQQSPMAIEILSSEGKIEKVTSSWKNLWGADEVVVAEILDKYNMLTDPQMKEQGVDKLVEKAFSGEHVILPPIIYDANKTVTDLNVESPKGLKIPWVQCHLHPIKDPNDTVINIVNTYIDISELKDTESELRGALEEIKELKDQLEVERAYLREEIKLEHNFESIIGNSAALKYTLQRVEQVALTDAPVLIQGETGTGKELIARALHELSPRNRRSLVKVNCAALPAELIESELFGREKGAFSGAVTAQAGRFEVANGSTLFLDEIGELPVDLQAKLLRVLDSGEFERLGSPHTRYSDARIIAATNRELEEEVKKNRFRKDLLYRLKVFPITVPSLRDRKEDIPLLARWFVDLYSKKFGKPNAKITIRTMQMLQQYHWPGNIRELKHAIEGACITARKGVFNIDLPQTEDQQGNHFYSLAEMERDYILRVLEAKNWKIGGVNSAASTLDMHVNTLRGRMKKLGIKKN